MCFQIVHGRLQVCLSQYPNVKLEGCVCVFVCQCFINRIGLDLETSKL